MKTFPLAAFSSLLLSTLVSAHGIVQNVVLDGKSFSGFLPDYDLWQKPNPPRIVRHIPNDGPVENFRSKDMTCGKGAQDARWRTPSHASVKAGGTVRFQWARWPEDHRGPVTTYMARCPNNDCTNFDASGKDWFKISERGLVKGTTDTGEWASHLLIKNNLTWSTTVPRTLQNGAYLIRHEILALHSAGKPQFYPSCTQVKVTGGGNALPTADELVAIPGIYTNNQSTMINIWRNDQTSYPIAGPRVAKLAAGGSSNGQSGSGSGSGSGGNSGSKPSGSIKTKSCKAKKVKRDEATEDKSRQVKRHVQRAQFKKRLAPQE